MADETTASIIQLHQPQKTVPKTPAQRARAYRARKRQKAPAAPAPVTPVILNPRIEYNAPVTAPVTPSRAVTPSRRPASILLMLASFGLAAVGMTMNGWFARSLGSSDIAGWLFLAIGVGADLVALAVPSCAARLWQARQRATSLAGWAIWAMTFAFAVTAGIGFASVNITDVTLARSSRITPAIQTAQAALADVTAARDRECKSGVGKVCREREEAVTDRRRALDTAMHSVEQTADPQTEAASRIVAWVSLGILKPTGGDFAMLRLVLLALLPQIGGILLMIGRAK
jgi:ABC-type Fe3+-siderophore transport system permease subunit